MRHTNPALNAVTIAFAALFLLPFSLATASSSTPAGPLIVDGNSHIVVMEYEAWFGPRAVTFQGTAAKPVLQSADMQSVGGGYDSRDPAVIQQHAAWMEELGVDAAIADLSNNVSCIFNSKWFAKKYLPYCSSAFAASNRNIRDNTGNLYPAWTKLGTPLKLIPLLGGGDPTELFPDVDGRNSLEKEIEYFASLMRQFPDRQVIYEGKPLLLIFVGAGQDPRFVDDPLWLKIRQFLESRPDIGSKYTFREVAGYLDSQPDLWLNHGTPTGPVEISPVYGFWSWVDRLNPTCTGSQFCPYFPSYNEIRNEIGSTAGPRVENFTVSISTAGQNGWGCPNSEAPPYCPDDALRYGEDRSYDTFESFMTYARQLDPIFLIVHQFNEFVQPDEGWDANTDDDSEPANLWGFGALTTIRQQIAIYRQAQE